MGPCGTASGGPNPGSCVHLTAPLLPATLPAQSGPVVQLLLLCRGNVGVNNTGHSSYFPVQPPTLGCQMGIPEIQI